MYIAQFRFRLSQQTVKQRLVDLVGHQKTNIDYMYNDLQLNVEMCTAEAQERWTTCIYTIKNNL